MSARREHMRRHLYKYEYGMKIDLWLQMEPPMLRIISWHRWKKSRPPKTWE